MSLKDWLPEKGDKFFGITRTDISLSELRPFSKRENVFLHICKAIIKAINGE